MRALADAGEREDVVDRVWGPPDVRQQLTDAAKYGGGSGGGAYGLELCGDCGLSASLDAWWLLGLTIAIGIGLVLYWLGCVIARAVRRWRARPQPRGADAIVHRATGRVGTVVGVDDSCEPIAAVPCVAYGVQLVHAARWRAEAVMLRAGHTHGFDVVLDTGERVRVRAGPVVFDWRDADPIPDSDHQTDSYLDAIDPHRALDDPFPPITGDRAEHVVVRSGDRVEVLGPLVGQIDAAGRPGDYRSTGDLVLVPAGAPRLRLAVSRMRSHSSG